MAKAKKRKTPEIFSGMLKKVSSFSEFGLPSEVLSATVANIEKLRQGVLDMVTKEVGKGLAKVDFRSLADEMMKNYTLKVNAELRLEPKQKEKKAEKTE